ncbi:MAG: FMN-binding protein [Actinobacteria bacterium]|nr:FMN-binding protein [Actinomycetota bacterium]
MRYGTVQVKITVKNGKITDAQALQAPSGSNDRYTQIAVPRLRDQTIAAQSANIQGVSGASYTSYAWYQSLASAIAQAGL